jgi:ABC-2 type transport system permease protein
MNTTYPMLIRREFWEHKSLWIAPLVWVGLITLFFTWAIIQGPDHLHAKVMMDAQSVDQMGLNDHDRAEMQNAIKLPDDKKETFFAVSFLAIFGLISMFMTFVVFFYLIDCLYTERKDRSILFWKSLPISDAEVVLSKLAVGIIIVPLGVILLAAAMQFLLYIIVWLRLHGSVIGEVMPDWSFVAWLRSQAVALGVTLGGVLWYAPIAAYLLLLSTWAKNKVFLWAVLPPIALPVLEKVFLGSSHVAEFLGRRFSGYIQEMRVDPSAFEASNRGGHVPSVSDVYNAFHLSNVFKTPEMWIGVAAAVALILVAIRIRRFRDDS